MTNILIADEYIDHHVQRALITLKHENLLIEFASSFIMRPDALPEENLYMQERYSRIVLPMSWKEDGDPVIMGEQMKSMRGKGLVIDILKLNSLIRTRGGT